MILEVEKPGEARMLKKMFPGHFRRKDNDLKYVSDKIFHRYIYLFMTTTIDIEVWIEDLFINSITDSGEATYS